MCTTLWHAATVTTGSSTHDYDKAAPIWGDKMRTLGYLAGYKQFLAEHSAGDFKNSSVIDVGAGTGAFSQAWLEINGIPENGLTLLEPSTAMLERATQALRPYEVELKLEKARLGEVDLEQADYVLASHVIEHCPDPLEALQQMHSLLKPGGKLYLVVSKPHWCNVIIWFQWRHRTFGREEIKELLHKAGFSVESVYPFPSGPPSRTSRGLIAKKKN